LRDEIEAAVRSATPGAVIIADGAPRLPNTLAVSVPGMLAETLVIRFDLAGIAVSAGSACSSGKVGASHVLDAMNLPRDIATSAIRVSLGPVSTKREIEQFIAAWKDITAKAALAA
jgi:cysteine desulfurase